VGIGTPFSRLAFATATDRIAQPQVGGYVRQDNPVVQTFTPMRILNGTPRDAVADLLSALQVHSTVYCVSDLGAPWGFAIDGANTAKFHCVLEGACWLRMGGQDPVRLGAGELVILPRGEPHAVSDARDSPVLGLDRIIADHPLDGNARLRYGGDGPRTRLLCGGFALGEPMPGPLLTLLPTVLTLEPGPAGLSAWIDPVFALVRQEASNAAPGAQAIFAKLADVFLAQALRAFLVGAGQAGLLQPRLAGDPRVERAAALVRDQPAHAWTLQSLARDVGMSRTLLATRFREVTGESPMRYLAKVRLGQAAGYLTTSDLSLEAIAARTGYAGNASLSKAFKREFGVSPGAYRETRGDGAGT
jgi:AraC-like DNA-binding protein/mannose-6-phosphate isomerase-like protein (cupin superfamily)